MKKLKLLLVTLIGLSTLVASVKADEIVVAKIGDTEYTSLDTAIAEANDNDTIELLSDTKIETTAVINKNITINGNNKVITISTLPSEDGKLDIHSTITLNNTIVNHGNENPSKHVWSVCMRSGAVLNLNNSVYTLTIHGMYAYPGATINLDNSKLIAHNMTYTAFQGDVEDEYANMNLYNNSLLEIYDIRTPKEGNGTNWFSILADNSHVSVTGCARQGLVGGRLELKNNSVADYNNNEIGFTLYSKDYIKVHEGTTLNINNNTSVGIWQYGGTITVTEKGNLTMTGNGYMRNIDTTGYNGSTINITNFFENAKVIFEDNANIKINNNYTRGIANKGEVYIGSNTEIMNNGLITPSDKMLPQYGGGIYNEGIMTIKENVKLYNNHARLAGDDIYNIGTITFSEVGEDWILDDCNDKINGWYDDKEENRWEAHDEENNYINEIPSGEYSSEVNEDGKIDNILAAKAAHDLLGKVVINYVDSDGNKLTEEITLIDSVGEKYTTIEKEFEGYTFITVEGPTTGEYIDGTIYVTYYYDKNIGTGDITPPQTGVEASTLALTTNTIAIYKKED